MIPYLILEIKLFAALMNLLERLRKYQQTAVTPKMNPLSTRMFFNSKSLLKSTTILDRSEAKSLSLPKSFSKFTQKESLPPIYQLHKAKIFDLQPKRSQVIQKLLISKHHLLPIRQTESYRNKTQIISSKRTYKLCSRSNISTNFDEIRMKPVDKYYYRLDNIRLAERLLIVKPSPELKRGFLKKFYLQQKSYRSQISKNQELPKLAMKRRGLRLFKQWSF